MKLELILTNPENWPSTSLVAKASEALRARYVAASPWERDPFDLWTIRAFRAWLFLVEVAELEGLDIYDASLSGLWDDFLSRAGIASGELPMPECSAWDVLDPG